MFLGSVPEGCHVHSRAADRVTRFPFKGRPVFDGPHVSRNVVRGTMVYNSVFVTEVDAHVTRPDCQVLLHTINILRMQRYMEVHHLAAPCVLIDADIDFPCNAFLAIFVERNYHRVHNIQEL